MPVIKDQGAFVGDNVEFTGTAHIGFCSYVGYGPGPEEKTLIEDGADIGAFCIVGNGVHVGAGVEIDHYCQVASGATIGENTKVLYRAQIFDDVKVGRNCIIAGELVDRTVVGDHVTFQGDTVHSHNDPNCDWETTEEPSPVIEDYCVVGFGAILIGGIRIGPRSYVAAGEIVRCDVPEDKVFQNGQLHEISKFRGLIKVRTSDRP